MTKAFSVRSSDFDLDRFEHVDGLTVRVELVLFAITHGQLELFMVEGGFGRPDAKYLLPGSYMLADSSLENAANTIARQLGFSGIALSQFDVFSSPDRDRRTRTISVAYWGAVDALKLSDRARLRPDFEIVRVGHQSDLTLWCDTVEVKPGLDHFQIIKRAIDHLRAMLDNSTLAFRFLPEHFTLRGLQGVHEAILGRDLEKVLFRKRLLGRIFPDGTRLRALDETWWHKGRPARVYHRVRIDES